MFAMLVIAVIAHVVDLSHRPLERWTGHYFATYLKKVAILHFHSIDLSVLSKIYGLQEPTSQN